MGGLFSLGSPLNLEVEGRGGGGQGRGVIEECVVVEIYPWFKFYFPIIVGYGNV